MKNFALIKTRYVVIIISCLFSLSACDDDPDLHVKETKTYSSDVAIKWLNMQVKQMREYPPTIGNVLYSRHYAYSGIALYEAVVPGMSSYQSIASQLNGLTGVPKIVAGVDYHFFPLGKSNFNRLLIMDTTI